MEKLASAIEKGDLTAVKEHVNTKNINNPNCAYGQSPLIYACYLRKFDIAKFLISKGADVNQKTSSGSTALIVACDFFEGDSELVAKFTELLLKNGAKPNAIEKNTDGAIHYAAMYGHYKAVKLLVENKASINKKGAYGRTALIYASSSSSSYETTKFLIDAGANLKAENDSGEDALIELISSEKADYEIAKLLIENELDVNRKLKSHGTYLHWAAFCGRKNIVKLLLEKGAKINAKDQMGDTPISLAMNQHKTDIVKYLFRNNSKTDEKDFSDILKYAVDKQDLAFINEIITKLKKDKKQLPAQALIEAARKGNLKVVKILIEAGIPADSKSEWSGETALMKAAYYGKLDVVKYLFKQGASIKVRDYAGNSPLLHAAWSGHKNLVAFLLKNGADINVKNKLNWNALMQACIEGHYTTAKFLLEKGSPTDEIDKERGVTALSLAKHIDNKQLIDLLLSYGAKERPIKKRKKGEDYFSIFDCDVCHYIPHKDDLGNSTHIHNFEGLKTIYTLKTQPDRYTDDYEWVKKCEICGTYYHHNYSYDDEDAFISGPHIYQNIQRYNLERLKTVLKKLKQNKELSELNKRYQGIIKDMQEKITSKKEIHKNFLPYVIENLTDFYIMQNDWKSLKSTLLEHKNSEVVIQTAYDLMILYSEEQYNHLFPYYREYRDCPTNVQRKLKPIFKKHFNEILKIVQVFKNSENVEIINKYQGFMYFVKNSDLKGNV